jgi:hypothetical protein
MANSEDVIWVKCASCGNQSRKHKVLCLKVKHLLDGPEGIPETDEFHRFVECMGCESLKYVSSSLDRQAQSHGYEVYEEDFRVYPDAPGTAGNRRLAAISNEDLIDDKGKNLIPDTVWKMYRETIDAFNANIRTLAGGGLRAVVEAICIDKRINAKNLMESIDELSKQGFLTKAQAELLHEERYLGNAALHEMATPSIQDIEDGLGIVEGLIATIYVLPSKAERLKTRREAKKSEKKPLKT